MPGPSIWRAARQPSQLHRRVAAAWYLALYDLDYRRLFGRLNYFFNRLAHRPRNFAENYI